MRFIIHLFAIWLILITIFSAFYQKRFIQLIITEEGFDKEFRQKMIEENGLLAIAPNVHSVSLIMRKPIIIPMQLDMISYLPEITPLLNEVSKAVYGFDILNPPPEAYRTGRVPIEYVYNLWVKRTRNEWIELRKKYGITGVLIRIRPDYKLDLPVLAKNNLYEYYKIPEVSTNKNKSLY